MALAGLCGVAPAQGAPSDWCSDDTPGQLEIPILPSPVYLAATVNPLYSHVELCYRAGPAAGAIGTIVGPNRPNPTGAVAWVYCASDPGVSQPVNCDALNSVSTTPNTSGTSVSPSGAFIGFEIPFQVCLVTAANCNGGSPELLATGVAVGGLAPVTGPPGSVGAGYGLSFVEVWLNGSMVYRQTGAGAGAFGTPGVPGLSTPTLGSTPPCVIGGLCLDGKLAVTGATTTVTLVLPTGTTPVPITVPSACIVNFDAPC
ncbi:MAG TPA: hypothetical protein VM938_11205 [Acidimicrobiales bacterium]|nr:hypothetical protein [Acidimicrobiales bacterium]